MRGLKLALVSGIRTATTSPVMTGIVGHMVSALLVVLEFLLFVQFVIYAIKLVLRLVVVETVGEVLAVGRAWGYAAFNTGWDCGRMTLQTVHWSWLGATYALGARLGWVTPTALPPLGDEYHAVEAALRRRPLAHPEDMSLAHQVADPYQCELQQSFRVGSGDGELSVSSYQLRLAEGLIIEWPLSLNGTTLGTRLDILAIKNKKLGRRMRSRLEKERATLRSFRLRLREQPAASLLQEPPKPLPPWKPTAAAFDGWWATAWRAGQAAPRWILLPSVRRQLLGRVARLESTLRAAQAVRLEWAQEMCGGGISDIGALAAELCPLSGTLRLAKRELEADMGLLLPTPAAGDKIDDIYASASRSRATAKAELGGTQLALQIVLANFAHICTFAKADEKRATGIASKLADDKLQYHRVIRKLEHLRDRIKNGPLADLAEVVGLESEMDVIARWALESIKYWEERQQDG